MGKILEPREWMLNRIFDSPLLKISAIPGLLRMPVYAQCELYSPTGSHKDRMYLHILRELEASDRLKAGSTVIDYSSGNGGAALACVAGLLGYRAIIVRPEGMSLAKAAQITSFGARLVETPKEQGVEGAVQGARRLAERLGGRALFLDQGDLSYNKDAYRDLGNSIGNALLDAGVNPSCFVCTLGTGGTFFGLGKALKKNCPDIQLVAVDIEGDTTYAHALGGHPLSSHGHPLEGVSTGKIFGQVEEELIDKFIVVSADEAYEAARCIWRRTQIFAGPTSGANFAAVAKLNVADAVTMLFDAAWKYLDDPALYRRSLRDRRSSMSQVIDWIAIGE